MSGFQGTVNRFPAPALAGDFASDNPRKAMVAGDSALVAAAAGVTLGLFARADLATGIVTNAHPGTVSSKLGWAAREGQPGAFITTWMASASMVLNGGNPIVLHVEYDGWVKFAGGANINDQVFASYADGSAVAGSAAPTATFSAGVTSGDPHLVGVTTAVYAGEPVSGTGIPAGAYIVTGAAIGGNAVMNVNATAGTGSAETVTRTTAEPTGATVMSTAAAGEVAMIAQGA